MNIRRYNPICAPLGDGSCMPEMEECANGNFYSRADLIAAGVLVPVPNGEAVALENLEESALFMNDAALMKFARFHPSNFCKCIYVDSGNHTTLPWHTIVQPVRLELWEKEE